MWTDLENAHTFDYKKYIIQYMDAFDRDIDVNNYENSISQIIFRLVILKA